MAAREAFGQGRGRKTITAEAERNLQNNGMPGSVTDAERREIRSGSGEKDAKSETRIKWNRSD
ncbi:MAG TPA: hypothetical protein DCZ91_08540 [Lachnospiraceae bacterium]|nr:hypothetical protein [Lachnospiraceae bacterium]